MKTKLEFVEDYHQKIDRFNFNETFVSYIKIHKTN